MLPELLEFADGDFWIEVDNNKYELHTSLFPKKSMSSDKREKLLSISKSGKNAAGKEKGEAWDELEKSIIANISDDVIVSIHEKKVEIVIKKTF